MRARNKSFAAAWAVTLSILFAFVASVFAAPVKLAIIETSTAVANPAALLTVSLSKSPALELLERAALDKIIRERGLAANQISNAFAASRILGADAILFLDVVGPKTNQSLSLRLVSVKEGAVLNTISSALAPENLDRWTETIAAQIGRTAAKLTTDRSKVIPIALLNLRSPSATSASELLDRELTSLLLSRLAAETNLLMLERRKLLDVALEKDFAASTEQFWAGAYLLDGSVNKDSFQPDKTTVSVRLVAPNKGATEIEVSGQRTNLSAIIENVVNRALDSLKLAKSVQWDAAREAQAHAEEASWALRWKMYPEAQAAADSAWALGLQTRTVAVTRALAYGRDRAESDPNFITGGAFNIYWPSHPPLPERSDTVFRSMAILDELLAHDPPAIAEKTVFAATTELLDTSGRLLMAYYSMMEARVGREEQLAEWRRICRNIQTAALKNSSLREPFVDPFHSGQSQYELKYRYSQTNFFKTVATYTGIFFETPEEPLPVYRDLFEQPGIPFIREIFTRRFSPTPRPVGGWKWIDRKRDVAVWDSFVQDLCSSTNALIQLEGRILELGNETDWDTYKARYAKLLTFLDEHWSEIEPRKNELLLTYAVSANFHSYFYDEAQKKEEKELSPQGYQFLADRGVSVGQIDGRKYEPRGPIAVRSESSKPTPTFAQTFHGPALKPGFIELSRYGDRLLPPPLHSQIYREGKFWVRNSRATRPPYDHGSEIFAVDLKSMTTTSITPLHTNYFTRKLWFPPWNNDSARLPKSFEVRSNELFVAEGNSLWRARLSEPKWNSQPIPIKDPDIYQVNGRLFLSASDSIYELEDSGGVRLLASARRKPAASSLDQLDDFNFAPLSPGPNRALRAFVNGNGYQWDDHNWTALTTFSNLQCKVSEQGAFFTTLNSPTFVQLHSLRRDETAPQYLAVGVYPKTDASLYAGEKHQWVVDADGLRGGHFFADSISAVFCRQTGTNSSKYRLLLLPPNAKGPVDIRLDFDEKPGKGLAGAFSAGFRQPWALNTPDGLVLGHALLPGFWVIPKSDLDDAVTKAVRVASEGPQIPSTQ